MTISIHCTAYSHCEQNLLLFCLLIRIVNTMSRVCTVCSHKRRKQIESAITTGVSNRRIATQFSTSESAIRRHKENCIKPAIQIVQGARQEQSAWNALAEMAWMGEQVHTIYNEVREVKDYRVSLQALNELRRQTELRSELTGELDRSTHVELHQSPEWMNVREIIFSALQPYPEAKVAVARALFALGGADGQRSQSKYA